ncbi:MAG: ATP-binding protein [Candidatus Lokiarchaeota archaeon]|nr:ATP-binding protein [Candidatus Lokiarchaeota archaeon]
MSSTNSSNLYISKIIVEKLFGKYSYEIPNLKEEFVDYSSIMILYGFNGSGKTTILNLLFNLLSYAERSGHKSYISNVVFEKFEVQFSNNIIIIAKRKPGKLIGAFDIIVNHKGEKIIKCKFIAIKEDKDRFFIPAMQERILYYARKEKSEKDYRELNEYLYNLNLSLYYLTDERKILNIKSTSLEEDLLNNKIDELELLKHYRSVKSDGKTIKQSIRRAEDYLHKQITETLTKVEIDVNNIYSEIISSFEKSTSIKDGDFDDIKNLKKVLEDLSIQSEKYAKFNLMPPLSMKDIIKSIDKTSKENYHTIISILKPYINGIKSKFSSLEKLYNILKLFTDYLSNFFFDKEVEYRLNEGIVISDRGIILNPEKLSSGEIQLLTLFCNILPARKHSSIFIIDEPEISLNVEWQRELIPVLLELTKGNQIQFIFATHSIEFLTLYSEKVVDLVNNAES